MEDDDDESNQVKHIPTNKFISQKSRVEPPFDDTYQRLTCGVYNCENEVFRACVRCFMLICCDHFVEDPPCSTHQGYTVSNEVTSNECTAICSLIEPDDFLNEEPQTEASEVSDTRKNKRNIVLELRNSEQGYTCNKPVPRSVGIRCKIDFCKKTGKQCHVFSDEERLELSKTFYRLGDRQLQREFIVRHIDTTETKVKTTKNGNSRRGKSNFYFLPLSGARLAVCKLFFLNTLSVSEKTMRTALNKVKPTGVIESDKRGGRHDSMIEKDNRRRQMIEEHINKFPRVGSRQQCISGNFLHSDLSLKNMYLMYLEENGKSDKASIATYGRVLKAMNLSFHKPEKLLFDHGMTNTQKQMESEKKLEAKLKNHIMETTKVLEIMNSDIDAISSIDKQNQKYSKTTVKSNMDLPNVNKPQVGHKTCEINNFSNDVFSTCVRCFLPVCYKHFNEESSCCSHKSGAVSDELQLNVEDVVAPKEVSTNVSPPYSTYQVDTVTNETTSNKICQRNTNKKTTDPPKVTTDENSSCSRQQALIISSEDASGAVHHKDSVSNDVASIPCAVIYHPEEFVVESQIKHIRGNHTRENKRKLVQRLRHTGQAYIRPNTMNICPPRTVGVRCKMAFCKKSGKQCHAFSDATRAELLNNFYKLGSLQLQREFIAHHIDSTDTKVKTTKNEISRRGKSNFYFLPLSESRRPVCKLFFINTLGISEKTMRTALNKLKPFWS